MTMEDLNPCPWCGQRQSERQMLVLLPCDTDGYYVMCDSCGACGPVGYPEMAEEKAYDNWNELAGRVDSLRNQLRDAVERANKFSALGASMRDAQKDYFRTRHQEALTRSKKLESDFDKLLKDATATEKQGSLL